jgi:hypothetical protein
MRTKIIGTARAALLTAGFVALGVGTTFPAGAYAGTNGNQSAAGGNQAAVPVNAPINLCGNSFGVFGQADGNCEGGASAKGGGGAAGGGRTSGKSSVGGGNQATAPINAPANACGNSVAVFGKAASGCAGGAKSKPAGSGGSGGRGHRTSGRNSAAGGNQATVPVNAPVNVCGNSAATFGDAVAGCEGGANAAGGAGGDTARTHGERSALGGNQVHAPAKVPVNVCGNAVGNAVAGCKGGAKAGSGGSGGSGYGRTSGKGSVGGGNQAHVPGEVPVDVCGNAAGALGEAAAACAGGSGGHGGGGGYGGGNGGGGYDAYGSRMPLSGGGPADAVAPKLPTVPGITQVRSVAPAGVLPDVPELPVGSPAGSSSRTAAAATTAAPAPAPASALPEPVNGVKGGVRHGLKNTPVGKAAGHLPVSQDAQDAPHTMRPAAAGTPLSSGVTDNSLYVLALGALLAGASTVIAVTRRVRFGRR